MFLITLRRKILISLLAFLAALFLNEELSHAQMMMIPNQGHYLGQQMGAPMYMPTGPFNSLGELQMAHQIAAISQLYGGGSYLPNGRRTHPVGQNALNVEAMSHLLVINPGNKRAGLGL